MTKFFPEYFTEIFIDGCIIGVYVNKINCLTFFIGIEAARILVISHFYVNFGLKC